MNLDFLKKLKRLKHFLKHTDVEVHIVDKTTSFKIVETTEGTKKITTEDLPNFKLEGTNLENEVFDGVPRKLTVRGTSEGVNVGKELRQYLEKGFESANVVKTKKRCPSLVFLGVLKDGVEVKNQDE